MKKFLIYVVIIVTCLFLGFTIYYLTLNNENIYLVISDKETIYKNAGTEDSFIWLDDILVWEKPYKTTELEIVSGDENVVSYDKNTRKFNCINGGFTSVTITPSNENFGPFIFEIAVGDGSLDNPWVIDSEEDLARIGNDPLNKFNLFNSYILTKDLDLNMLTESTQGNGNWTPVENSDISFSGNFDGNGHTIYNMNITSGKNAGLFSTTTSTANIENLKFVNATINGSFENAGVVAGINNGLIGKVEVLSATINNTKSQANTGLICGSNTINSVNAKVNMCSASGSITAEGNVGGLVGFNKASVIVNSKAVISDFVANSADSYVGGLVGLNSSSYDDQALVYTASAIKNSYVVINNSNVTNAKFGYVIGKNYEEKIEEMNNFYSGIIYCSENELSINEIGETNCNVDSTKFNKNSKEELILAESYPGYDFDNVWFLEDYKIANINFLADYENLKTPTIGQTVKSSSGVTLSQFLTNVKTYNKSYNKTYSIDSEVVIDLGGQYWETLCPDSKSPMAASIIVEDGYSCTIKNFKLKENNSSFFGYISYGAVVDGITFEDVYVESCSSENSGIVATSIYNQAELKNIKITSIKEFNSSANNIGLICGSSIGGIISNCSVVCSSLTDVIINTLSTTVYFGGIVGNTDSTITSCVVDGIKLNINTALSNSGTFNIGGIVGFTKGSVEYCAVDGFMMADTASKGVMYVGGVVGYTDNEKSKVINYCYYISSIDINTLNTQANVGGIAGVLSAGYKMEGCFYDSGWLSANNVGGLACVNKGTINSCYVGECELIGNKVGGISYITDGTLTNSYVLATLSPASNVKKESRLCGITYSVGTDCLIEHNFSNASFNHKGVADCYAEAFDSFRIGGFVSSVANFFGQIFNKDEIKFGTFKNNIILVNDGAKIQKKGVAFKGQDFIKVTLEECNGQVGDYSVFKYTAGFSDLDWNFDPENGNGLPTLKKVVKIEE